MKGCERSVTGQYLSGKKEIAVPAERRPGIAVFRAAAIGDVSHLYAAGQEPSFAARFCEVYGNGDRVD